MDPKEQLIMLTWKSTSSCWFGTKLRPKDALAQDIASRALASLCALYQGFCCLVPVPLDQVPFQRLDPLNHPVGIGAFQRWYNLGIKPFYLKSAPWPAFVAVVSSSIPPGSSFTVPSYQIAVLATPIAEERDRANEPGYEESPKQKEYHVSVQGRWHKSRESYREERLGFFHSLLSEVLSNTPLNQEVLRRGTTSYETELEGEERSVAALLASKAN
ncbi:metal cation transporter ATPase P-type CtpE [Striga asiatica]|uniref:Metal cation transporter ATPase P-type CtpE n=1 Tax=Striga asiatica TaxID=4170 RepID=A0A5A7QKY8_STRAF|nr:metal cation transporter ATPase P-type CtpE [Striga asiatica]